MIKIKLNGKLIEIKPTWKTVIAIEDEYGSIFALERKFISTVEDVSFTLSDLVKAFDVVTLSSHGFTEDELKKGIVEAGMLKVQVVIRSVISAVAVTGTEAKSQGK